MYNDMWTVRFIHAGDLVERVVLLHFPIPAVLSLLFGFRASFCLGLLFLTFSFVSSNIHLPDFVFVINRQFFQNIE